MQYAAIYWISIDVVFTDDIEIAIRVGMNRSVRISQSAADMDMR